MALALGDLPLVYLDSLLPGAGAGLEDRRQHRRRPLLFLGERPAAAADRLAGRRRHRFLLHRECRTVLPEHEPPRYPAGLPADLLCRRRGDGGRDLPLSPGAEGGRPAGAERPDDLTRCGMENRTENECRGEIIFNIDVMLAKRKMSLTELSHRVGITMANISILKTGKAKAIRISTLTALCEALDCQPGDLLEYRKE